MVNDTHNMILSFRLFENNLDTDCLLSIKNAKVARKDLRIAKKKCKDND